MTKPSRMRVRLAHRLIPLVMPFGLTLAASLLPAPQAAWAEAQSTAKTDEQIREEISTIVSQRHPTDTAATWRALGPEAPRVIIAMLRETTHTRERMRLLQGLGWFDTPEAVEFLRREASETKEPLLRKAAITTLGISQGSKEIDFISRFLTNEDPDVRFGAAQALRRMKDARANQVVDQYLAQEKTPWIAAKLKGDLPKAKEIRESASSEDRLHPALSGEWKGVWVTPSSDKSGGMVSEPATLQLKPEGPVALSGKIAVRRGSGTIELKFDKAQGKNTRFSGKLPSLASGTPEPLFEAELKEQKDAYVLELRALNFAGFLLVRRSK